MSAFTRILQKTLLQQKKQVTYMRRHISLSEPKIYSKTEVIPLKYLRMLQQDYDLSIPGILRMIQGKVDRDFQESEKYISGRHQLLGPDLAAAHFIVVRDGAVKFVGKDAWFKADKNDQYFLPNRFVEGMHLEAIDCSNTRLSYTGLDNLVDLTELRYLNLSSCVNIDDWCMSRLHHFQDSLQFLDISGCSNVTERGLLCIHQLKKLEGLRVADMGHITQIELVITMLEELLPNCIVFGLNVENETTP